VQGQAIQVQDAKAAGLRYVDDRSPGIRRRRTHSGFTYTDAGGDPVRDEAEIARIKALAIPPAYEDVWICPHPRGHLQATGRDARGRKQYRYHRQWREVRDANKYESTIAFAKALPALRARIAADLARTAMTRENVLASVVRMLETTLVRIGNENYARDNDSYGLTTLRARHVRIEGAKRIRLRFRGKSGVEHAVTIEDRRLAKTIKRCRDLPGETLFCFIDDEGETQPIASDDVNDYIREAIGDEFSAKNFRTWTATVACAVALEDIGPAATLAEAKEKLALAVSQTAKRLGNTSSVCRKAYIHPVVIETYLDTLALKLPRASGKTKPNGLDAEERRVLRFLEKATSADPRATHLALLKKSVIAAKRKKRVA
jgi:DNA topoisomerase-1